MNELMSWETRKPQFRRFYAGQRGRLVKLGRENPVKLADTLFAASQPPYIKAIGFKVLYNQPPELDQRIATWQRLASTPGMRVLHTVSHPVRSALSFCIAMETGRWVGKKTAEPIRIDADRVLERLRKNEEGHQRVIEVFSPEQILDVRSKEVLRDRAVADRMLAHIGVEPHPLTTTTKRQNPKDISDVIVNYEEVVEALVGTAWEGQLPAPT